MTGTSDDNQRRDTPRLNLARALGGVTALCPGCHRDVPGVDGVVLAAFIARAGWIILSDSGRDSDQLEDLQATLGEGPRIDVATTGGPVGVLDLASPPARSRWPHFGAQALTSDIRAVFAFPVALESRPVGVLSVYRATAGRLSAADHDRVSRSARKAAVLLRAVARLDSAGAKSMPLPDDAGEVQQAVGVIMQHTAVDAVAALHYLRACAHGSRRPMREVVAEARTGRLPCHPSTVS